MVPTLRMVLPQHLVDMRDVWIAMMPLQRPETNMDENEKIDMVPGMGFEPMTFGFPWKRSI